MSGYVTKTLKFKLEGSEVDAQYGDLVLKSNTETVTNMITTVAGVGVENCVKMGTAAAAATAIYFVAKSMLKYWPWMRVSNVKNDNVLEVEIPKKHEDKFNEIVAKERIVQNVNTDFEEIDTNLEGVVGEDASDKYGKEIKKLIEHVRVTSVVKSGDQEKSELTVAAGIIAGENTEKITNSKTSIRVRGQSSGTVAGVIVVEGGVLNRTMDGCTTSIDVSGGEEPKTTHKELTGNSIKIIVEGKCLNEPFEKKFKPTETIFHVIRAIKKKERKNVSIFRDGEELDDEITMEEVAKPGSVLTLEARIE